MNARNLEEVKTLKDWQKLPEGNSRYELINGAIYMFASPAVNHQIILNNLMIRFNEYFKGKSCKPLFAPVDVFLFNEDEDDENVVVPDLLVICDKNKIKTHGIYGAPDLIIEILSPSTVINDRLGKRRLYERYGVREYIIVDINHRFFERYTLKDFKYGISDLFADGDIYESSAFDGLNFPISTIYEDIDINS